MKPPSSKPPLADHSSNLINYGSSRRPSMGFKSVPYTVLINSQLLSIPWASNTLPTTPVCKQNPSSLGGGSNLHWPICGQLFLIQRIWKSGIKVPRIPIIHAQSWLAWGWRLVSLHLIWMVQWQPRLSLSPYLPVGILWTHIRTICPWQQ